MKRYTLIRGIFSFLFVGLLFNLAQADESFTGQWDSTINNLNDHPLTIALRIEVYDADTRIPLENARVSFKGMYMTEHRTSRDQGGEQQAQRQEYELTAHTGNDGVAIAALFWQKEYPWRNGIDEVEKIQTIEVVRRGYRVAGQAVPYASLLDVGQDNSSNAQKSKIFDLFEKTWAQECSKENIRFCTLRFAKDFPDLDRKTSKNPAFFQKIRNKDWGIIYDKPINKHQKMDGDQRLCGPYLIYTLKFYMNRMMTEDHLSSPSVNISPDDVIDISPPNNPENPAPTKNIQMPGEPKWQLGFLEGLTWGMSGEDVEKNLSQKGYTLTIVSNHASAGTEYHEVTVSGQPSFGTFRVENVRMSFANKKLDSVSFSSADATEAMINKFYTSFEELFGPAWTDNWPADDKVKQSIPSPELIYKSEWYFPITAIEAKKDYGWSRQDNRYVRYSSVKIYNWIRNDETQRSHALRALQFQTLRKEVSEKNEIPCRECNGTGQCSHCSGKGYTLEYTFITCPDRKCRGNGKYRVYGPGGGIRICERCGGTGKIKASKDPQKVTCPQCNGTGKCSSCNGTGHTNRP